MDRLSWMRELMAKTAREGWWCENCPHSARDQAGSLLTKTCMASGPMQCRAVLSVLTGGERDVAAG